MGNKNCLEKKELLILIFLTIISVLLRGYKYRITFMLPYTYKYLDPSLFTRDLAFFNYDLNLFFYMNAYLSQFFSYETIFFIGYFIGLTIFYSSFVVLRRMNHS